jgi:hypothetical protein
MPLVSHHMLYVVLTQKLVEGASELSSFIRLNRLGQPAEHGAGPPEGPLGLRGRLAPQQDSGEPARVHIDDQETVAIALVV